MTNQPDDRPKTATERLYTLLFEPKQQEQELRNREIVGTILLFGTGLTTGAICLLLLQSYLVGHTYVLGRLLIAVGVFSFLVTIYWTTRHRKYGLMASLLAPFYGILALAIVWTWGINTPFGILVFSLAIVLAGILLGPFYALAASLLSGASMIIIQFLLHAGIHHPSTGWTTHTSSFGDAIGYCFGFAILGLTSWLFGRQMAGSLHRALHAEAALTREKALLEARVEGRTAELQKTQFQEIQQMYRFAELGQLSTGVLHELANYLTALTIDIEDVESKKHAGALSRAKQVTAYLDEMVDKARDRLNDTAIEEPFDLAHETNVVIGLLEKQANDAHVELVWHMPADDQSFQCKGDASRFRQIVTVLVANAIDAYQDMPRHKRGPHIVRVSLEHASQKILLKVCDFGVGISNMQRTQLFQPYKSSKNRGMGVGLVIAKQVVETHFKGKISLSDTADYTEFVVELSPWR